MSARPAFAAAAMSGHSGSVLVAASRGSRRNRRRDREYVPTRPVALWPAPALPYEQLRLTWRRRPSALRSWISFHDQRQNRANPCHPSARVDADRHAAGCASSVDPRAPSGRPAISRELLRWVTDHGYEATPLVPSPAKSRAAAAFSTSFRPGPISRFASIFRR